jgi:hypothetical protein
LRQDRDRSIFAQIESGLTLTETCKVLGYDRVTIWRRIRRNRDFCNAYAYARQAQADALAELAIGAANDGRGDTYIDEKGRTRTAMDNVWRSKLKFDAYRWFAARIAPHKYADRMPVQVNQINANGGQTAESPVGYAKDLNVITPEVLEDLRERRRKSIERIRQANPTEVTVK